MVTNTKDKRIPLGPSLTYQNSIKIQNENIKKLTQEIILEKKLPDPKDGDIFIELNKNDLAMTYVKDLKETGEKGKALLTNAIRAISAMIEKIQSLSIHIGTVAIVDADTIKPKVEDTIQMLLAKVELAQSKTLNLLTSDYFDLEIYYHKDTKLPLLLQGVNCRPDAGLFRTSEDAADPFLGLPVFPTGGDYLELLGLAASYNPLTDQNNFARDIGKASAILNQTLKFLKFQLRVYGDQLTRVQIMCNEFDLALDDLEEKSSKIIASDPDQALIDLKNAQKIRDYLLKSLNRVEEKNYSYLY
jgi:hypothetical protein